jgi:hypothetical protein
MLQPIDRAGQCRCRWPHRSAVTLGCVQWLEEINLYGNEIDEAGALLRSPEHTRALLRSPEHTLSSTDSTAAMQPALLHPVECVVLQRQLG